MRTLFATILLFIAAPAVAQATCYDWPLRTSQGRMAYDGDTIRITMPGLPPELSEMLVRVAGVDTPEIRGKCISERVSAIRARDFVIRSLTEASSVSFCNPKWGKYGKRVVADVMIDGKSLAAILIERGLGRPYGGRRREGWCQ